MTFITVRHIVRRCWRDKSKCLCNLINLFPVLDVLDACLLYIMFAVFHATSTMIWWNKDIYKNVQTGQDLAETELQSNPHSNVLFKV